MLNKQLSQKTGIALVLGVIVWVGLLMQGASIARNADIGSITKVAIGPLVLNHINRTVSSGGTQISITFAPALLWYFLAWILLGLAIGYLLSKRSSDIAH